MLEAEALQATLAEPPHQEETSAEAGAAALPENEASSRLEALQDRLAATRDSSSGAPDAVWLRANTATMVCRALLAGGQGVDITEQIVVTPDS